MTPGHVLPRVAAVLAAIGLLVLPVAERHSGVGLFLRRDTFPFAHELMAAGVVVVLLLAFACYTGPSDRLRLAATAALAFAVQMVLLMEGAGVTPGWGLAPIAIALVIGAGGGFCARHEWAALRTDSADDRDVDIRVWAELVIGVVGVALWFFQIVGFFAAVASVLSCWVTLTIRRVRVGRRIT